MKTTEVTEWSPEKRDPLTSNVIDCGYRIDLLFDEFLIVELKSIEHILGIHEVQILTYMKLPEAPVGRLINSNVKLLTNGVRCFSL
jgi:GxxExxY protein